MSVIEAALCFICSVLPSAIIIINGDYIFYDKFVLIVFRARHKTTCVRRNRF